MSGRGFPTDGTEVGAVTLTARSLWERVRRPELLKTFQEEEYGVRPVERPAELVFREVAPLDMMPN